MPYRKTIRITPDFSSEIEKKRMECKSIYCMIPVVKNIR